MDRGSGRGNGHERKGFKSLVGFSEASAFDFFFLGRVFDFFSVSAGIWIHSSNAEPTQIPYDFEGVIIQSWSFDGNNRLSSCCVDAV